MEKKMWKIEQKVTEISKRTTAPRTGEKNTGCCLCPSLCRVRENATFPIGSD